MYRPMIVAARKTNPITGLMMVLAFSIMEIGESGVFNNGMIILLFPSCRWQNLSVAGFATRKTC
uniref:Uncharacterized protein n=1 Tax=mine drainage metagenome TaxID=410659 RepID=E6QJ98_9ZZZZ